MRLSHKWILILLGVLLITANSLAFMFGDLRKNTITFEIIFFSAFVIYGIACLYILQLEKGESSPPLLDIWSGRCRPSHSHPDASCPLR